MVSSLGIRSVRREELKNLSALIKDIFDEFIAVDCSRDGINEFLDFIDPNNMAKRYDRGNYLLVAVDEEEIVGMIELREFKHISLLFVKKEYHSQGIGKELVDKAMEVCKKNYYVREITVNSCPYAVGIYEKLGFIKFSEEKFIDGIKYTPMKKCIF